MNARSPLESVRAVADAAAVFSSPATPPRAVLAGLALTIGIVLVYAGSLSGQFLWDDNLHISDNPTIVGPLGLKEIWTSARALYFPLVLTNFWVQHAIWGLDPLGYRIVTLLFHIAATLLLWRVLRRLQIRGAWLGAALWGLHPVQVESVAWICELKNTQSAVFFLAAVWAWTRWLESKAADAPGLGARRFYVFTLVFAVLAILSKPSTVMLPVALGLCGWWLRRQIVWREAVLLAPFFALSALAAGWTIWEQKFNSGAIGPEWQQSFLERLAIAGRVVWFYLGKLLWPEPLIFIYPRWQIDPGRALSFLPIAGVATGLLVLWWRRSGRAAPLTFAAFYFVVLLFPVLGFFNVYFFRYSYVGDHFQYLASIGPLAFIGAAIASLQRRAAAALSALGLIALAGISAREALNYRSSEALWRHTVAENPDATMAWLNLAELVGREGRHAEAKALYRRALQNNPRDADAWNDLGVLHIATARPELALPLFEHSLALDPNQPDPHNNLANALQELGRYEDAVRHHRRALELDPQLADAHAGLAIALLETGAAGEARRSFEAAVALKPDDPRLRDNFATGLRKLGDFEAALEQHERALQAKPDAAAYRANRAVTLSAAGRHREALTEFEHALRLEPSAATLRGHYATALERAGRPDEALGERARTAAALPQSPQAQLNYGTALVTAGRTSEAIAYFQRAVDLAPSLLPARQNLATALAARGRWQDAIPHFQTIAEVQPRSASARTQLAIALVNAGELAAALPHFESALLLEPNSAEVRENFAQVLRALGRTREAFEQLEEAARLRRQASGR